MRRYWGIFIILLLLTNSIVLAQTPTPPIPRIFLDPVSYDTAQNEYLVPLRYENPNLINALQVRVISDNTQIVVFGPTRYIVTATVRISGDNLVTGEDYIIYIEALDTSGNPITVLQDDFGSTTQVPIAVTAQIRHQPLTADLSLSVATVELNAQKPAFIITLQTQNTQAVFQYEVWLQSADSGLRIKTDIFAPPQNNQLQLSVAGVDNGKYIIVVNAQDNNRQLIASAQYPNVLLNIQHNIFENLGNPLAILGIFLVLLLAIGLFLYSVRKPQNAVYSPQGGVARPPQPDLKNTQSKRVKANAVLQPITKGWREIKVTTLPFVIGRDGANGVIDHDKISRKHAIITRTDNQYYIQDANSTNGTFLNNIPLQPHQPYLLPSDSIVRFGQIAEFRFKILG